MTITTNEHGQQNMFAKEPKMYIDPTIEEQMDKNVYQTHNEKAEMLNGRVAMISVMIGIISYVTTGKLFLFTW
jgi:hypothetical protein